MRWIICAIVFLIAVQGSGAIYSGWLFDNQTVTIDEVNYITTADEGVLILREVNGSRKVVLVVEGKKQVDDLVFVHVAQEEIEGNIIDNIHVHGSDDNLWKHQISVTRLSQAVTPKRTIIPTTPFVFDEVQIEWSMQNTGTEMLTGIRYQEQVPLFLKPKRYLIKEKDEEISMQNMNFIDWRLNLNSQETLTLIGEFEIIGMSQDAPLELEEGSLTYTTLQNPISSTLDAAEFPLKYPLEQTFTQSTSGILYTSNFDTGFNFHNLHTVEDLDISYIRIDFPHSVIVRQPEREYEELKHNSFLFKTQKLEPSEQLEHIFELTSDFFYQNQVNISTDYVFRGREYTYDNAINLTTTFTAPSMDFQFKGTSGSTIRGGDILEVEFSIINNEIYDLRNARAHVQSDLFEERFFIFGYVGSKRGVTNGKVEKKFSVRLPTIDTARQGNVNMTVTFISSTNDTIEYTHAESLSIAAGISDQIFDLTGNIINLTDDKYFVEVSISKLTTDSVSSLFIDIDTAGESQTMNSSIENLYEIDNRIATVKVPAEVKADLDSNFTKMVVTLRSVVDGRDITEKKEYFLNGTVFLTEDEVEDLKATLVNETEDQKPVEPEPIAPLPPDKGDYKISKNDMKGSNLMYFIFGLVGVLVVVGIYFFVDYIKTGKKSGKVDYDNGFSGGYRDISSSVGQGGSFGAEEYGALEDPGFEDDEKYKPLIGSGKDRFDKI